MNHVANVIRFQDTSPCLSAAAVDWQPPRYATLLCRFGYEQRYYAVYPFKIQPHVYSLLSTTIRPSDYYTGLLIYFLSCASLVDSLIASTSSAIRVSLKSGLKLDQNGKIGGSKSSPLRHGYHASVRHIYDGRKSYPT